MSAATTASASVRIIKAEHVLLALVSRKIAARQVADGQRGLRWAAMSNGHYTPSCRPHVARFCHPRPPLLQPMERGNLRELVERTRWLRGLDEVRRTWGCGLRAMLAEAEQYTLLAQKGGSA